MSVSRRSFLGGATASLALFLGACAQQQRDMVSAEGSSVQAASSTGGLDLNDAAWSYNADDDVYYQLGVSYCESPADVTYENLALFVPGGFFSAVKNGDGTYTCVPDGSGTVGSYTAATAPIVMPVNTPGYSAQLPLSEYSSQTTYTSKGIVYVHVGCRGRDHGAPAGVVDLKAAVRFLRRNASRLAGNVERIFTFGHSGGGAQSTIMGATGDSELYEPYLEAIGAATDASDAIFGSMGWCPITNLDTADEAYEWMMGCTRSGLGDDEQAISDALAAAYAAYVNAAGITDEKGNPLELEQSDDGIWQAGSYYDQVKAAIEESLNNFLADTEFPYDASSSGGAGGMGGAPGGAPGDMMSGEAPDGAPSGEAPSDMGSGSPGGEASDGSGSGSAPEDGIGRTDVTGGITLSGSYDTVADYIDALNADGEWVTYDEGTNTAAISSVAAFCAALKQASKSLGAFDQLDRGQGENTLFGYGDGEGAHFDATLATILDDLGNEYADDYLDDLNRTDALGNDVQTRLNMYTPLYYLLSSQDGYGQSEPARHWRIRSGITQGDTALTCELNLALALKVDPRVESVDFATVWGQGHTQAERTGSATENFIAWIEGCMA